MRTEKFTEQLLVMLGFIKCCLVAAFFAGGVLFDSPSANAENNNACQGENVLTKLQVENPSLYAQVLLEAEAIANGTVNFWKIEKEGQPVSYLFGTMHMADPRIATVSEIVKSKIRQSKQLVIESVESLDPAVAQQEMAKLAHLTMLSQGTLRDLVRDDLEEKLEKSVKERGLPIGLADRLQPWLIATMVALPVCEIERKQAGESVLDVVLAKFAQDQDVDVVGLETVAEQLTAIAGLPQAYHVSALEETLEGGDLALDMIETLKQLYLDENMALVLPLMKAVAPKSYSGAGAVQFQEALLEKRNIVMVERLLPMLDNDTNFVAVGALHLPGDLGLVTLLRNEGYTLTPVHSPS